MADSKESSKPQRVSRVAELKDAQVSVTGNNRLQVEFRIDDLLKKLLPGVLRSDANCGGCNGCTGCSM
jgi:hypothetical protein